MAHETPTITAEKRDRIGTRYARRLRQSGRLPAVIYGHQQEPLHISVDAKETLGHLHHGAHLVNIEVTGNATQTCLVKDLQFGYLGDNVIHIDLSRVDLNEEVTLNISLHITGEPEAAKKPGAVLEHVLTELEVICKAMDIPSDLTADISDIEDTFTVGDLQLPEGVRTAIDPATPIATITFIEEEAEGEEVEIEGEAQPEVIGEVADKEAEGAEGEGDEG